MRKKLYLLDGMALVYRAHFALIARPIFTSKGVNTSALYGFTQTLLEILRNQQPTHIAVAFDTEAPTHRHAEFADYKATRQAMPEDLSNALPDVRRMLSAFNIPVITCDGYEADDLIGTLVRRAEKEGFESYMVTPDKDFGQLVTRSTFVYKPSRMGDAVEIMGVPEICHRWGISNPAQVIDLLALMGDSSDNIPGIPGVGEKTASKLIRQFGTVEDLLARSGELTGKIRDTVTKHREAALLSKRLATIVCDAPCDYDLESLKLVPPNEELLKAMFVQFEFNSIGRRLFGDDFKAGRGFESDSGSAKAPPTVEVAPVPIHPERSAADLKNLSMVLHEYRAASSPSERARLVEILAAAGKFGFSVLASGDDAREAKVLGFGFALAPRQAWFVPAPSRKEALRNWLGEFEPVLSNEHNELTGHNLKHSLLLLKWHGTEVTARLFDTMVAHSLIEPDLRHSLDFLSEAFLGYTPLTLQTGGGVAIGELQLEQDLPANALVHTCEAADLALQLRVTLEPLVKERAQERVFYEVESPLIAALADMEYEGIKVDSSSLERFASQLSTELRDHERAICQMAGTTFNLHSPRQLGQILFDVMKICDAPKKTRTGQYVTDEQTLATLAPDHEIVRLLLEHRAASKLKSTYADALPLTIWPATGRIHTTYNQVSTSTGRLNSQNPNLQNIPIRTERGQEIRKAFVPRGPEYRLLSADYSQIELRIIAALSKEAGLLEAFASGIDVHTATAARVFGVPLEDVTPEMRRRAKMVNYGIAYGISAFGLAQRLSIPRKDAALIIEQYFRQFSGIRDYMDHTIQFAKRNGYVETVTGRRRYIRDINSSNATVRGGAERNAINAPIQGTAADMIKIAMVQIHQELNRRKLRSRMLLQVHDELVFDLFRPEEADVRALVEDKMKNAIALPVPIVVEIGVGENWLEAH